MSVPSEPIAATTPSILLRLRSGTARAQAGTAREEAVHASAMPISTLETIRAISPPAARHRRETGDINHGPRDQSNAQPEAVRNRASRRLRQTPDDILDCDGQREIRRGERQITRHRRQKQADTLPQTHADA